MTVVARSMLLLTVALVYNTNVWDLIVDAQQGWVTTVPNRRANAGMGWEVALGRLFSPTDPTNETGGGTATQPMWVFESPDAAAHVLYTTDNNFTGYSKDASYYRMRTITKYQRVVDFPDGRRETFNDVSAKLDGTDWRLVSIDDNYGNQVQVSYPSVAGYDQTWKLVDSEGRVQMLYFINSVGATYAELLLDHIDLTSFNGGKASYQFSYVYHSIARDPRDMSKFGSHGPDITVPFLTAVTLPGSGGAANGSSYSLTDTSGNPYYDTSGDNTGMLRGIQLPTRGWIEYDYARVDFPGSSADKLARTHNQGLAQRRLLDATHTTLAAWDYTYRLSIREQCRITCPSGQGICSSGDSRQSVTLITGPPRDPSSQTRDTSVHYFSVFAAGSDSRGNGDSCLTDQPWNYAEYGMPVTHYASDADSRPLSVETRTGIDPATLSSDPFPKSAITIGQLLRSGYVTYEYDADQGNTTFDTNRRVKSERNSFDDDPNCSGACYSTADSSSWDTFGHYRQTSYGGNFTNGTYRTTFTNYDGTLDASNDWILGTYSEQCAADETQLRITTVSSCSSLTNPATTEEQFERSTGFLLARRTLTGSSPDTMDLLATFTHDAHGLTTAERYYGGDQTSQALSKTSLFDPPAAPNYEIDHTYPLDSGRLIGHTAQYSGSSFFSEDDDRDPATGLIARTRDTTGHLGTSFEYDFRGRLAWIKPDSLDDTGAWTNYVYTDATASAPPQVEADMYHYGVTSGTAIARAQYFYDGIGRFVKDRTLMPDGTWATSARTYNGLGWLLTASERESVDPPPDVTTFSHDAFGRTTAIQQPDLETSSISYLGIRALTRTSRVATTLTSESDATTTETRDSLGRLIAVSEYSGGSDSVITTYTYDSADRLLGVSTPSDSGKQTRTFGYDNRGFLLSEQHPELGSGGNGSTTYSQFDARGHAHKKQTGAFALSFDFDVAERVTLVHDASGRTFKQFAYDDPGGTQFPTQCALGRCNGKLAAAIRYHYFDPTDLGTIATTEALYYDGPQGQLTRRDRTIGSSSNFTPDHSFFFSQTYNDFGHVASITYPCHANTPAWTCADTTKTVSYSYTDGLLTSVANWASSITYQPSGLVATVTHTGGVHETWSGDPHGMMRPSMIQATDSSNNLLWSTGAYAYDGAGNVKQIGQAAYTYDLVNRLNDWKTTQSNGSFNNVYQEYDRFGNRLANEYYGCVYAGAVASCYSSSVIPATMVGTTNHYAGTTYDDAGNVTSNNASYDDLGMLKSWSNGRQFRYLYSPDDERIAIVERVAVGGTTRNRTTWTLRGFDNQLLRSYLDDFTSGSEVLSWKEDEIYRGSVLLANDSPTGAKHYSLDHLGSPRLVTNVSGQSLGLQNFDPFGSGGTSDGGMLQFTAQERDDETMGGSPGLPDYFHARMYDKGGRFLSIDPVRGDARHPQSWNRYSYVMNQPVNNIDPKGLCTFTLTGGGKYSDDNTVCAETTARNPSDLEYRMTMANIAAVEHLHYFGMFMDLVARELATPYLKFGQAMLTEKPGPLISGTLTTAMVAMGPIGGPEEEAASELGQLETDVTVTFSKQAIGHGERHLAGSGLTREAVEASITKEVQSVGRQAPVSGWFSGRINVNGTIIEYRGFPMPGGGINVGTYYIP